MICSTTYRSVLSLAGAVIMTLGTFSMLQASAPWESHRSEIVRYHDAALERPADATRLYKRIHSAAQRVCAPLAANWDLNTRVHLKHCIDDAVSAAVAEIDHPQLNAIHSATIGRWRLASERLAKPGV